MIASAMIVLAYLVGMILIGIYFRSTSGQSKESYWLADRKVGTLLNGFALAAVLSSAAALMGFIGLAYKFGPAFVYAGPGFAGVTGFAIAQMLFVGPLRKSGRYSASDFLDARYRSSALRLVTAIITAVLFTAYIVAQLKGAGLVGQFLLGLPYLQAMLIAGVVFVIYTSIGGMWAVTVTDFIQGILLLAVVITLIVVVLFAAGGLQPLIVDVASANPNFNAIHPKISKLTYFGFFIGALFFPASAPHMVMRSLSVKDIRVARNSALIAMIAGVFIYVIADYVLAAGGTVLLPQVKDPDNVTIYLIGKFLPPVFGAIALAGLLAAMMSTVDGMLLAIGTALTNDVFAKLSPRLTEKGLLKISFWIVWIIGVISILIAIKPPALIGQLAAWLISGTTSTFFFPLILGIWWKRANKYGALAGVIGGFGSFVLLSIIKVLPMFGEAVVAIPLSGLLTVVVSLITPAPSPEEQEFCESLHAPEVKA